MSPAAALDETATLQLPGRRRELDALLAMLGDGGPDVATVHGIGGVGKSALVSGFAQLARSAGASVVELDCRHIAPTPIGLLSSLAVELGVAGDSEGELEMAVAAAGENDPLIVVLDHYEALPLLDTWVRQHLVTTMVPGAKLVIAGRQALHPAWRSVRLAGIEITDIELDCLDQSTTHDVLTRAGVAPEHVDALSTLTGGHPLSIWIAVDVLARQPGATPERVVAPRLANDLAAVHLDGLDDITRTGVDALAVVRRGTRALLAALLPEQPPGDVAARLEGLPFVESRADGLAVHDAVRATITGRLEAEDPVRHAELRRRAWRRIRQEFKNDPTPDTWRYTADLLFLIENPLLREGFFPRDAGEFSVQTAEAEHVDVIDAMIAAEAGDEAPVLGTWLERCPGAWKVALDVSGCVAGCALVIAAPDVPADLRRDDPVVATFESDRRADAVPPGQLILYLRAWLTPGAGEMPSAAQAALWLDCKRAYLDHRRTMRRLYTSVTRPDVFLPVVEPLGFDAVDSVGDRTVLRVDFGPGGVNGWLSEIASRELGLDATRRLDTGRRVLTIDEEDIALTPLECGVVRELLAASGRPVSRADLIAAVWGHSYSGGSNVVDAVVRTLRRKLGVHSGDVETVRGVGYRYLPS